MTTTSREPEPLRRVDDLDYSNTRLHSPNFQGARITDGWLVDADISADIRGLRINGIEVEPLIDAERDRLFPERVLLRSTDPAGLAKAWEAVEQMWAQTVRRAQALPASLVAERVDGDWSFVETLRHLILATDLWCNRMIFGSTAPYHPWGLSPGGFPDGMGLDESARPGLDEVLVVRRERMDTVRRVIDGLDAAELERICEPPATPGHPNAPHSVLKCLHVILDEEWEHHRYATRDLDTLESRST